MTSADLLLSSYDYDLPPSHIAQLPASPAHNAKLLIATPDASHKSYSFHHTTFFDLPNHLSQEYLLFFNETKVFKARIPLQNVKIIRASGKELILEQGEVFVYQLLSENTFECLVSDSKNFKPGSKVQISDTIFLESQEFTENGIKFQIHWDKLLSFLEKYAQMPLPPYIKYEKEKEQWYQTFFAQEIGSAAAPTASAYREIKRKKSLNAVPLLTCWSLNIQARFRGNYLQSKTPFWALDLANEYPKNPRWGKTARKNLSTNWNHNDQVFRVFTIYLEIFEIKKSDSITESWNRKVARPSDKRYWSKTCWGVYSGPRAASLRKYPLSITNDYTNKIIYQARNPFLSHRWADYQFSSAKIITDDADFSVYGKKKPLEYISRGYGKMILLL